MLYLWSLLALCYLCPFSQKELVCQFSIMQWAYEITDNFFFYFFFLNIIQKCGFKYLKFLWPLSGVQCALFLALFYTCYSFAGSLELKCKVYVKMALCALLGIFSSVWRCWKNRSQVMWFAQSWITAFSQQIKTLIFLLERCWRVF